MIEAALPLLSSLMRHFMDKKDDIAKKAGVSNDVVGAVTEAISEFLSKDERAMQLTMEHIDKARAYDMTTFDAGDKFSNRLRSTVRPICTFVAMGWYVIARIYEIELQGEDYAIVGGILAFWFGFRPFEKIK